MKPILWIFSVIAVGLYICNPIQDPDLWWHLTIGRWIISHGEVPTVEVWNRYALDQPFRAYSWSNEVVFALIDRWFSVDGLLVLKMVLGVGVALSACLMVGLISGNWFLGLFLGCLIGASTHGHFTLRPQSFTWIYLSLSLLFAELYRRGESAKLSYIGFFLVMMLWANTHITTLIGLGAAAVWLIGQRPIRSVAGFCLIGLAGTFVTPYFGAEWLTFFHKTGHPLAFQSIAEFQPLHILQYPTGFLVAVFALLGAFLYQRPKLLPPIVLLAGGALFLGAMAVAKFLPIAVIFLSALIARQWYEADRQGSSLGNIQEAISRLEKLLLRIPSQGLGFVILAVCILLAKDRFSEGVHLATVPVDAMNFFEKHDLPHPLLHDFGRGGYVMYRFADEAGEIEHPVVIDGRTNITPPKIFELSYAALKGERSWKEYFEEVQPKTVLWRANTPLVSILIESEEWCLVFDSEEEGSGHVLFVESDYYRSRLSERLPSTDCS